MQDAELERVRDFHMVHKVGHLSGWKPNQLLSSYIQVVPKLSLPFHNIYDLPCKDDYSCCDNYVNFLLSRKTKGLLPLYQLPGKSPVIDHIKCYLDYQPSLEAGGSYKDFLSLTLDTCSKFSNTKTIKTDVKCVTFGLSRSTDVSEFFHSLNSSLDSLNKYRLGCLPTNYYHLEVDYINIPTSECQLPGNHKLMGLPSRMTFGLWEQRWEILFPWKTVVIENLEVHEILGPTKIPDYWAFHFKKIHGHAVGLNLKQDLYFLSQFFSSTYEFSNKAVFSLKSIDIYSLLALAGINMSCLSVSSLSFLFNATLVLPPCDYEQNVPSKDKGTLPDHINLYKQVKATTILNAITLSQMVILIHIFPTPGIACLMSRKNPENFFRWFTHFITTISSDYHLPAHSLIVDRTTNYKACLTSLHQNCESFITVNQLVEMLPSWNSIVYGGCPTDQLAISHAYFNLLPVFQQNFIRPELQWYSKDSYLHGLFGPATGAAESKELLGCRSDKCIPMLPDFCANFSENNHPVINMCRKFKSSTPESSPIRKLSINQLMILYVWQFPHKSLEMYQQSLGNPDGKDGSSPYRRMFHSKQIPLVAPILFSYYPNLSSYPDFYKTFLCNKRVRLGAVKILDLTHDTNRDNFCPQKRLMKQKSLSKRLKISCGSLKLGYDIAKETYTTSISGYTDATSNSAQNYGASVSECSTKVLMHTDQDMYPTSTSTAEDYGVSVPENSSKVFELAGDHSSSTCLENSVPDMCKENLDLVSISSAELDSALLDIPSSPGSATNQDPSLLDLASSVSSLDLDNYLSPQWSGDLYNPASPTRDDPHELPVDDELELVLHVPPMEAEELMSSNTF